MTYECADCGRADWNSIAAMMQCPCNAESATPQGRWRHGA